MMSIKHAILGLLSRTPLTGYDLKKRFAESATLYWSGNNNQIYRTLVELHEEQLVTKEVHHQEDGPSRKVYTITNKGLAALRQWLLARPELPELRHSFLIQLMWADQLEADQLDALVRDYEEEVQARLLMLREQAQRDKLSPEGTPRGTHLEGTIAGYWISFYAHELDWVRQLREDLCGT
jgi:DNA-binding PadR family transcriptional regulator